VLGVVHPVVCTKRRHALMALVAGHAGTARQLALPSVIFSREPGMPSELAQDVRLPDVSRQQEGVQPQAVQMHYDVSPVATRNGHVWFNTPMNSSVDITPYSQVYGLHPRFFHFDGNGSMELTPVASEFVSSCAPQASGGSISVAPHGTPTSHAVTCSPGTPISSMQAMLAAPHSRTVSAPGTPCRRLNMSAQVSPTIVPATAPAACCSGACTPGVPGLVTSQPGRILSMPMSWSTGSVSGSAPGGAAAGRMASSCLSQALPPARTTSMTRAPSSDAAAPERVAGKLVTQQSPPHVLSARSPIAMVPTPSRAKAATPHAGAARHPDASAGYLSPCTPPRHRLGGA